MIGKRHEPDTSTMNNDDCIRHETAAHAQGNVHTVWVNNPARLNILNSTTLQALDATLQEIENDLHARVVVLRGSGERAWIGGADIREMAELDADTAVTFIRRVHGICHALRMLPIPVIAAIRGYCLGAGLEVAASCDLRLAAQGAAFAMPEVRVGLPSVIEASLLPRLVGIGRARDLVMTARTIDADEALRWGLIDSLVPNDDLDTLVDERVEQLLAGAPAAMRIQKMLCRAWEEQPLGDAIELSIEAFGKSFESDEPRKHLQQFLNRKR
jgi:enoyl-CoA hydratase/carnithine racemase